MINSRFGKKLVYFLAIAAGVLFLAGVIQTSFLPLLGLFGAVPDLVLILTCGVAFTLGPTDGAVFGLVGGIMIEGLGGYGLALAPLFYTVMGFLFGALSMKVFLPKFTHLLIYDALFCTVKAIYSLARILLSQNGSEWGAALVASVLPELAGTFLLALALTVPTRALAGLLRGRMSLKKGKGGLGDL